MLQGPSMRNTGVNKLNALGGGCRRSGSGRNNSLSSDKERTEYIISYPESKHDSQNKATACAQHVHNQQISFSVK